MNIHRPMLFGLVVLTALFASGCCKRAMPTERLDPGELSWKTYVNESLRFSLAIPEDFSADEDESGVRFWFSGDSPARVDFVDEETGRGRGLWFGHPSEGEITLGGRTGQKYVYEHYDGPFCSRMVAFVVPYRDRYLALQFRATREIDAVQERILEALAFTGSRSSELKAR